MTEPLTTFKKSDVAKYWILPFFFGAKRWIDTLRSEKSNFRKIESVKAITSENRWNYQFRQPSRIQTRLPSKTIPDDALLLLKNGNIFAKEHYNSRCLHNPQRGEMYFSQLNCVVRYTVPETFVCEIPEVFIHSPTGAIVTSNYELILQSGGRTLPNIVPPMKKVPSKETEIKGTFVSLMGYSSNNYSHWIMDILPRLTLLTENNPDVRYLFSKPIQKYQLQSAELWGISENKILPLNPGWYRLERIFLCYPAERSSISSEIHLHCMSNRLKKACGIENDNPAPTRYIYISRANSRRKLINEKEILPVLKEYGFEVILCEDISLKDQIKLFNQAKIILGDHGSGMNNQIFSPPGAMVIEMYNPAYFHHCICITSNIMGHEHWHTFSKNVDNEWNSYMDRIKLNKLLGYIFDVPDAIESIY